MYIDACMIPELWFQTAMKHVLFRRSALGNHLGETPGMH